MEEGVTTDESSKKGRIRWVVVMAILVVVGIAVYASPILMYPDNIVHDDTLCASNNHSTQAHLTLTPRNAK